MYQVKLFYIAVFILLCTVFQSQVVKDLSESLFSAVEIVKISPGTVVYWRAATENPPNFNSPRHMTLVYVLSVLHRPSLQVECFHWEETAM